MKIALLILAFAVSAFSQLPEYGTLDEIKGKSKIYVAAEGTPRRDILKQLTKTKGIEIVNKSTDADFVLEYKTLHRERVTSLEIPSETGQLEAFVLRDQTRLIVWSKDGYDGFKDSAATSLIKKFLKERARL